MSPSFKTATCMIHLMSADERASFGHQTRFGFYRPTNMQPRSLPSVCAQFTRNQKFILSNNADINDDDDNDDDEIAYFTVR